MNESLDYIFGMAEDYPTGLSPHYPILYAIVRGLEAINTFEFGAGYSTRVILEALTRTSGFHTSVSTDTRDYVQDRYSIPISPRWNHLYGYSRDLPTEVFGKTSYDFVLHDGAHDELTVRNDLRLILPRMKRYGIICIHDTLHGYCGEGMRRGILEALEGISTSVLTLPFGYGLTIVRMLTDNGLGSINVTRKKLCSLFSTEQNDFR